VDPTDIKVRWVHLYLTCCSWPESGVSTFQGGQIDPIGPQVDANPRFCGPLPCPQSWDPNPGGDYTLRSDSPCLPEFSPCGQQIGRWGLGCQAPEPVGACCLAGERCVLLTAQECANQQGTYEGDGASCYPNPCVVIPVESTTWGRIKANFR
jgi:hypothetical protein